jgi:lysophospholipase L1-like esterase
MKSEKSVGLPPSRATPLSFKIALGLLATLVGLGFCELVARIVYPAPPDPTRQPQIVYRYDRELRYVLEPNQKGWIDDGFVNINSLGFRGPETAVPKPADRFRVVVIGDSLAMGWGVADDQTFSAHLERLLHQRFPGRDLDVVNISVGGYDTFQEVGLLKRNVERLQPDLVLVGFYSNDVPDGLEHEDALAAGGTRIAAANPELGQILHMNPAPSSWWERAMRRSRAAYVIGRTLKGLTSKSEQAGSRFAMEIDLLEGKDSAELERAWGAVEGQLEELHQLARSRFAVGIVVLPCREQVAGQYPQAMYQRRIRTIAERLGFFVVDPLPSMVASRTRPSDLFIPYDRNHPSAAGHRLISERIFDAVVEHEQAALTSPAFAEHSGDAARLGQGRK